MRCAFCKSKLDVWPYPLHTTYGCMNKDCINDDMPRYQVTYNNYPTFLISRTFMFKDDWNIIVNYRDNCTIVSKLMACIIYDSVQIPRALDVDLSNPYSIIPKIKTLMTFS